MIHHAFWGLKLASPEARPVKKGLFQRGAGHRISERGRSTTVASGEETRSKELFIPSLPSRADQKVQPHPPTTSTVSHLPPSHSSHTTKNPALPARPQARARPQRRSARPVRGWPETSRLPKKGGPPLKRLPWVLKSGDLLKTEDLPTTKAKFGKQKKRQRR